MMGEEGCALRGTGCVGWGEQVVQCPEQEVVFIEVSTWKGHVGRRDTLVTFGQVSCYFVEIGQCRQMVQLIISETKKENLGDQFLALS